MAVGTKIQIRRDTATAWAAANPVLFAGEIGHELDTNRHKVGDGVTAWNALRYFARGKMDDGQQFTVKRDVKAGRAVVAVFGDSTGAIATRWPMLLATKLAADNTDAAVGYSVWNDTAQTNDARVAVQAGTSSSSAGTATSDAFTHNSGSDLKGTTSDTGQVWAGATNAAGNFTLNGTKIVRSAATAVASQLTIDSGITGDRTVTLTGVSINTLGQSASTSIRLYAGQVDTNNNVYLFFNISTTGNVSWGLTKTVAGSATTIATGGATGLATNSATVNTFNVSIQVAGVTVTGTLNGVTVTGTLASTAENLAVAGGSVDGILAQQSAGQQGLVIDAFSSYVTHVGTPSLDIEMYNGSFTGSVLSYQTPRISLMCPEAPDLILINSIHNYGAGTPATYLAALDAFIDLVSLTWPSAGIAVMTQNPEKAGTLGPQITAHAARNLAVRSYTAQKGVGYIGVYEAFRSRSDLGLSYVRTDGVHPTDTTDSAAPNGASLWTDTIYNWLKAKSLAVTGLG